MTALKKPANIIYGLDETPPILVTIMTACGTSAPCTKLPNHRLGKVFLSDHS